MNFFLLRLIVHVITFIFVATLNFLFIKYIYTEPPTQLFFTSTTVISIISFTNILGEIVLNIIIKNTSKESLLKTMIIRTIKFFFYLILVLYITLALSEKQEQYYLNLLVVILFFVYAIIEFTYFKMQTQIEQK